MTLTGRQLEILTLYARGMRQPEIAEALYLSPKTVKRHLSEASCRLGTRSVAHSLVVALARGQLVFTAEGAVAVPAKLDPMVDQERPTPPVSQSGVSERSTS